MTRTNPFRPNSPIGPGMFIGRLPELLALEEALLQTRAGAPKHFMLTGERGIGKTSLLQYLRAVAEGRIELDGQHFRFLVIDVDIEKGTSPASFARKIERAFNNVLGKTERSRAILQSVWKFAQRVEAFGVSIQERKDPASAEDVLDELAYSLAETTNRICDARPGGFDIERVFDGVLLCVDEAENASSSLELGAAVKLLTERLQKRSCDRVAVGIAGLPSLRETLRESHPSSLRVLEEIQVQRLKPDEVSRVIDRCLDEANRSNAEQTTIDDEAREFLVSVSEGYPHFIQQFGYSAFAKDTDSVIDKADAAAGAFGARGALELIGDRYYRDDFYNKIQQDAYRQVLRIMADSLDAWISKEKIRQRFRGKDSTLSNALKALRDRHIILSKEGTPGVYRLQHRGFALWMKLYTQDEAVLAQLNLANASG